MYLLLTKGYRKERFPNKQGAWEEYYAALENEELPLLFKRCEGQMILIAGTGK